MLERMTACVVAASLVVLSNSARAEPGGLQSPMPETFDSSNAPSPIVNPVVVVSRTRMNSAMAVAGAITFAAPYIMSFSIAAANANSYSASHDWTTNALYVPVIGPFVSAGAAARSSLSNGCSWACGVGPGGEALLVIDGMTQGAGIALLVTGLVTRVLTHATNAKIRPTPIVARTFSGFALSGEL